MHWLPSREIHERRQRWRFFAARGKGALRIRAAQAGDELLPRGVACGIRDHERLAGRFRIDVLHPQFEPFAHAAIRVAHRPEDHAGLGSLAQKDEMAGRGIGLIAQDGAEAEIRRSLGGRKRDAANRGFLRGGGFFCGDHAHARAGALSASFARVPQLPSGLFLGGFFLAAKPCRAKHAACAFSPRSSQWFS